MDDDASAPASAGRRPSTFVLVVLAVTLVAAGVWAGLTVTGSGDGAGTPEGAAEELFTSLSRADLVGVVGSLPASERGPLSVALPDLVGELQRLGLVGAVDTASVAGLDVEVDSLRFRSVRLAEHVEAVDVVAGRLTVTADGALPATDDGRLVLAELGVERAEGALLRRDFAQHPLRLVAVDEGDGWHVSLSYSVAENLRRAYAADQPDAAVAAARPRPVGADTPEGAVRGLVERYVAGDVAGALGMLDPAEAAAFADYARVFVPDLDQPRDAGSLQRLDLAVEGEGAHRRVRVRALEADVDDRVQTIHVVAEGDCFEADYRFGDRAPYARFQTCGRGTESKAIGDQVVRATGESEAAAESDGAATTTTTIDAGPEKPPIKGTATEAARERAELARRTRPLDNAFSALALFGNGSQLPPVVVVERDGRWFVSPVRTLVDGTLTTLRSVPDAEHAVDLVRALREALEPRRSLVLEEAADPDNVLFGPSAFEKNPLVPTCFIRLAGVAGEVGVREFGVDCVDELVRSGRARPEDTPQLLPHGDCLRAEPTEPPAFGTIYRRGYLKDQAVRACLQAKIDAGTATDAVLGALRDEAEQTCWDPYRTLAATDPESAWADADARVDACFAQAYQPPAVTDP